MRERGSTAVYALLTMGVLLTTSIGTSAYVLGSLGKSKANKDAAVIFNAAQAALEHGVTLAMLDVQANKGIFQPAVHNLTSTVGSILPSSSAAVYVTPATDNTYAWVTAYVTKGTRTKSVRMLIRAKDVSIWNNAVFAGSGASGMAINGNVDIRGSMHVLGEGEPYSDLNGNGQWDPKEVFTDSNGNGVWDPGEAFVDANGDGVWTNQEPFNDTNGNGIYDPPLTQTDLNSSFSGTAYIGNNYAGMPADVEALVPTPPKVNGLETLGAEVRVKHGRIGIGGTATIGTSDVIDGGTSKSKIDGSYVSDGYTGNKGASAVYSDNGTNHTYDLENLAIKMPLLSGIGAQQYEDSGGNTWNTHQDYLNARSLTIPVNTITASTPAFSYGPDAYGNSITYTPAATSGAPGNLVVNGVVKISGNLQLGVKDTIKYSGSGTIYTTGHMYVDGNLLPNGLTFPTQTKLGLIAGQNMYLATGSGSAQLKMVGAFYAQGKVVSAKQNQIAGTFVANYYDMGINVPNIYQVPTLSRNMPPAMPGDKIYVALKVRTWRERPTTFN